MISKEGICLGYSVLSMGVYLKLLEPQIFVSSVKKCLFGKHVVECRVVNLKLSLVANMSCTALSTLQKINHVFSNTSIQIFPWLRTNYIGL